MSQRLWDSGLQPERVALSWQRTGLAIAVGALLYGRILADSMGLWALLPTLAGLAAAAWIGIKSRGRYHYNQQQLTNPKGHLADGSLPALLTLFTLVTGSFALVQLLLASN